MILVEVTPQPNGQNVFKTTSGLPAEARLREVVEKSIGELDRVVLMFVDPTNPQYARPPEPP